MEYRLLGEFVSLSQGLAVNKGTAHLFSDNKNEDFPYPLLRIVDFENDTHDNYSKYVSKNISSSVIIDENTIVFTRVTCQCFRGFKGVLHNNLFTVDLINDEITKDYLFTVLQSDFVKNQALYFAQSSVVPDLSHKMFKEIKIPVPDKKIQKKISNLYLTLTNKINNNNAINSKLESMAKTIYDYWFLQFEFPNEEGKPYKSSGGKMIWNEELKREIPEGWGVKSLDNISDYQNGFAFYKEGYDSSGAKVVDLGNVNLLGLYIDTKDDKYISLERYDNEKYKNYRLKKNDLIMIMTDRKSTMDLLGKTGRIYKDDKYLLNQRVARIRCHDDFNVNYLYATLNGTFINDILKGRALGSVQKYINSGDITTLPILIPSENIMKKFGSIVDEMYQKMDENLQENEELASLRDFLLPLLMNGQVGFKE